MGLCSGKLEWLNRHDLQDVCEKPAACGPARFGRTFDARDGDRGNHWSRPVFGGGADTLRDVGDLAEFAGRNGDDHTVGLVVGQGDVDR